MSTVSDSPAAASELALAHFEAEFAFETDCWDVHASRPVKLMRGAITGWLDEGFALERAPEHV